MARSFSIESNWRVTKFLFDNECQFFAKSKRWLFNDTWSLFRSSNEPLAIFQLKQKWFSYHCVVNVDYLSQQIVIPFEYKGWREPRINFEYDNMKYLILLDGHTFSFFKNEKQFAAVEQDTYTFGFGLRYEIKASNDIPIDLLVIICYVLLLVIDNENY